MIRNFIYIISVIAALAIGYSWGSIAKPLQNKHAYMIPVSSSDVNVGATTTAKFAVGQYPNGNGLCIVWSSTNLPTASDPDIGSGYAKLAKTGVNTFEGLQQACSVEDFRKLLTAYCAHNSGPAHFEVATVGPFGGVQSHGCAEYGCPANPCPQPF